MQTVFIGIETANAESLAELNKRQNLRIDLVTEVSKFVSAGTMVIAGMIVALIGVWYMGFFGAPPTR